MVSSKYKPRNYVPEEQVTHFSLSLYRQWVVPRRHGPRRCRYIRGMLRRPAHLKICDITKSMSWVARCFERTEVVLTQTIVRPNHSCCLITGFGGGLRHGETVVLGGPLMASLYSKQGQKTAWQRALLLCFRPRGRTKKCNKARGSSGAGLNEPLYNHLVAVAWECVIT